MKKSLFLAVLPSLLFACSSPSSYQASKASAQSAISAEGIASANLYLNDIPESAKDKPKREGEDESVKKDTQEGRLPKTAQRLLDRLDADDSGSLSEEEFLALAIHPNKDKAAKQTEEEIAKIQEKLKAEFAKHAGDDGLLSLEEIPNLLKGQRGRVGGFRQERHPGQNDSRRQEMEKELLAKFDKDGDGMLSPEEEEAIRDEDKENCRHRDRNKDPNQDDEESGSDDGSDPSSGDLGSKGLKDKPSRDGIAKPRAPKDLGDLDQGSEDEDESDSGDDPACDEEGGF